MSELLPAAFAPRISQVPGRAKSATLNQIDHLLIVVPKKSPGSLWRGLPDGKRLEKLAGRLGKSGTGWPLESRLANSVGTGLTVARLESGISDLSSFALLDFAGSQAEHIKKTGAARIGIMTAGFTASDAEQIIRSLMLAIYAHYAAQPVFRRKPEKTQRLTSVKILGLETRIDLHRTIAEAQALNLTRWLTALPPNKLDASAFKELTKELAKNAGWKMRFLDEKQLKKLGAGAFLAVAQGNARHDAGIIHLSYRPGKPSDPAALALVGKGIIFDTGGNNLKPFQAMLDMHEDMAGSAVALATLQALTDLNYPHAVDCWLAVTENRISSNAYKSRDVVTAANGQTIEVIHTDAEGRMALADTLVLASAEKPKLILDYATLTGACVQAVTDRYSGVFTNREKLNPLLKQAGRDSGERVWPFPMDADFDRELKSGVADVLQCAASGGGDHIQAAKFLQRFVGKNIDWVHVDLSACSRKGGLAQVPSGPTGFGVRFTLNLLLDKADELTKTR